MPGSVLGRISLLGLQSQLFYLDESLTSGEADGSSRSLPGAVVLADLLFISGQKDCVSVSEMNTWLPGSSYFEACYVQMSMSYTDVSELLVEFMCNSFCSVFP